MIARIRSLAVTPSGSSPLTVTAMVLNGAIGSVWVASTCSTWLVPMPNASAPNAPCVEVWLSPQTTVVPGWVSPSWGPTTCTTPCSTSPSGCSRTPKSAQFLRRVSSCVRETGSAMGLSMSRVGVLWSSVAMVRSVLRTGRPALRRPSKALRAGHLVQQVQIDEEKVGLALRAPDDMVVPDLLRECPSHRIPIVVDCELRVRMSVPVPASTPSAPRAGRGPVPQGDALTGNLNLRFTV